MEFVFCGNTITEETLNENLWLKYLYFTKENQINLERVDSVEDLYKDNHVLRYVERTLRICDSLKDTLSEEEASIVRTTLQWAEVAKCGMPEQRKRWQSEGLDLQIHNEASAEIYISQIQPEARQDRLVRIISTMIRTHGLLGQYIRGENNLILHKPLSDLIVTGLVSRESMSRMMHVLNRSIIAGVDESLWLRVEPEVLRLIEVICDQKYEETQMSSQERVEKLFPAFRNIDALTVEEQGLYDDIMADNDLWYAESALDTFSRKEIDTIFEYLQPLVKNTRHISFYPLSRTLTYDYEGHRKINVYKKRIVELCLREYAEISDQDERKSTDHVSMKTTIVGDTLYFDVVFTRVCDSLITFCVEAERSGIMTYEKSIQTIFDVFGFRRDIFDRLNNEEKYLETMNNAAASTKLQILDYITGDRIVDVGSGGGVLLDLLEKRFPEKTIIGTDISYNVIEHLQQKIDEEGHQYSVRCHNFVEQVMEEPVDTILFSSILHEVYSYTEWMGKRFRIEAVKTALKNAYDSLPRGGRIVIRDGIMSDSSAVGKVRFKQEDGVIFMRNYMRDFKGLIELRESEDSENWRTDRVILDGSELSADVNFIREALYTYTWGTESYAQEVMEQFGYFTIADYTAFLEELGMTIVYSDVFTEPGYPENLNPKVELLEGMTWEELPSTCIIAAEKA